MLALIDFLLAAASAANALIRAHRNDKLAAMDVTRLREESYWAAASGSFPNQYSRELDRRELDRRGL